MEIAQPFIDSFHSLFQFIPDLPKPDVGLALDLRGDVERAVIAFFILYLIDQMLIAVKWFPESKSETRYFSLHILVNAFVVVVHFPDVIATYRDPEHAYLGPCNTLGTAAIFSLHLYHMVFYQPLAWLDWVHHIVMIVVMLPLAYACAAGTLLGHGAFYASGLPGGVDYILLVMIKLNWIDKLTEKYLNCWIQLWIRAPGCMIHAWLSYHNYIAAHERFYFSDLPPRLPTSYAPLVPVEWVRYCASVVIFTFYWNGFFFLDRVIRSHERHAVQAQAKKKYEALLKPATSNQVQELDENGVAKKQKASVTSKKEDIVGYSKDVKTC